MILSCSSTPYIIAFHANENISWTIYDYVCDFIFLIDIFIIFNTAFYDKEFRLNDKRKDIAINYIKGWFLIDFTAILPFQLLIQDSSNINEVARVFRIGRLYKLIKLFRLVRVIKIIN